MTNTKTKTKTKTMTYIHLRTAPKSPRDLWPETWHLRHWFHFWQLRTTILTFTLWPLNKEWWWQHSQFLRCFPNVFPSKSCRYGPTQLFGEGPSSTSLLFRVKSSFLYNSSLWMARLVFLAEVVFFHWSSNSITKHPFLLDLACLSNICVVPQYKSWPKTNWDKTNRENIPNKVKPSNKTFTMQHFGSSFWSASTNREIQ